VILLFFLFHCCRVEGRAFPNLLPWRRGWWERAGLSPGMVLAVDSAGGRSGGAGSLRESIAGTQRGGMVPLFLQCHVQRCSAVDAGACAGDGWFRILHLVGGMNTVDGVCHEPCGSRIGKSSRGQVLLTRSTTCCPSTCADTLSGIKEAATPFLESSYMYMLL